MIFGCLIILICLHQALGWETYEGYKVYQVTPKNRFEADLLHNLERNPKYDFWVPIKRLNVPTTIMITPDELESFENLMKSHHIETKVLIQNVAETIKPPKLETSVEPGNVTFKEYMTHSEMNAYLVNLSKKYPDIVILEEFGKSYEKRDMYTVRITTGPANNTKPTIFIDAGIHAREWIAPPVALYIINQLVENSSNHDMFKDIDWVVLPVLNPDGYTYSREHSRYWRRTRSNTTRSDCPGVDANRNFDFHWMESGASPYPCEDIYAGEHASSEPEVIALSNYFLSHKGPIKLYLTFHSYGRDVGYPWGYAEILPPNADELESVGKLFSKAVGNFSPTSLPYDVGNDAIMIYPAAGGSDDYAMGVGGIDLAYTIELPDGGDEGFFPPEDEILPIVQETFAGIKAMQEYVQNKYVPKHFV